MKLSRFAAGMAVVSALLLSTAACNREEGTRSQYQRDATPAVPETTNGAASTPEPAAEIAETAEPEATLTAPENE